MNDLIERMIELSKELAHWVAGQAVDYAEATEKAKFDCDPAVTVFLALAILFILGSGCWASSIAASRRHNGFVHFVLGCLFPWIYPAVILFAMNVKGAKAMSRMLAKQQAAEEEEERQRQARIAFNSGKAQEEEDGDEDDGWTQKRLEKMARKADGTPAGPWDVVFAGRTLRVERIIEALPEVVSVEFADAGNGVSRLRIPYSKIESWQQPDA